MPMRVIEIFQMEFKFSISVSATDRAAQCICKLEIGYQVEEAPPISGVQLLCRSISNIRQNLTAS